ncbi:MAG: helix-turn-helix domain-containing protein, partial [Alphaproteobacteria bacterium]
MDDPDALFIPSPQEIGALVTAWRRLRGWKQETLAQFAAVSLSTIERIERGEAVSTEMLDRVAVALEFKEGNFHRPRPRRSVGESLLQTMRFFEGKLAVPCVPLKTQPQVAALLGCDAYVVDDGRCTPDADEAIASLRESLGFYRSALREPLGLDEPVKKREIYTSLLADVQAVERRGYTALHATYDADSRFGRVKVA